MNSTEQRILELCQRLQELGLNIALDSDKSCLFLGSGRASIWVYLNNITSSLNWNDLEAFIGFIESELDRLGKWFDYQEKLCFIDGLEVRRTSDDLWLTTRRPTPLEKLQAAVEAMEG